MAHCMTADGHSNRQSGNVGRTPLDIYSQGRSSAAQLRPDTGLVDHLEELALQVRIVRMRITDIGRTHQGALGQVCSLIHGSADAYAYNHRRTRVAACMLDNVQNSLLHTLNTVSRHQHLDAGLVLAAEALQGNLNLQLVTIYKLSVEESKSKIMRDYGLV